VSDEFPEEIEESEESEDTIVTDELEDDSFR